MVFSCLYKNNVKKVLKLFQIGSKMGMYHEGFYKRMTDLFKIKYIFRNNHGMSLLELGVIVAVLSLIVWTIDLLPIQNLFQKSNEAVQRQIEAQATILEIETLFETNGIIMTANANDITFSTDDGIYQIFAEDFVAGAPPYKIAFKKDDDQAYHTAEGVSKLTGPDRPGLEFTYRSQNGDETTVTGDMRMVDVRLTFNVGVGTMFYETTLKLYPTTIILQTDVGPHGLVEPPFNIQPYFKYGPPPGNRPAGGDF